jgi:hypothetical protein
METAASTVPRIVTLRSSVRLFARRASKGDSHDWVNRAILRGSLANARSRLRMTARGNFHAHLQIN